MEKLFKFGVVEKIIIQACLLIFAAIMLFPLYLAVVNANKPSTGAIMTRPTSTPPAPAWGKAFVYGEPGRVIPAGTVLVYQDGDAIKKYESVTTLTLKKAKDKIELRAMFTGEHGNISRGEKLSFIEPLAGVDREVQVIGHGLSYGAGWTWRNFVKAWSEANFSVYFLNSIIITASTIFIVAFFGSMTSYALARMDFVGRKFIFFAFMLGLIIPIRLALAPLWWLMSTLGLMDSLIGIILILSAMTMPTAVLIMTTFLKAVSPELEQAAKIDGATPFQTYYLVVLPLVKPAVATVCLLTFVWSWNEYYLPLVFLTSEEKLPITMGITQFKTQFETQWHMMLAGILIMITPTIIAFLIASKQFISGLTAGGVKE